MIKLESLKLHNFSKFSDLMEGKEFGGCYCAVWTSYGDSWNSKCLDPSRPNRETTKKNVEHGNHVGFLAFEENELIGWTGSGPKTSFPFLKEKLGSRLSPFDSQIWSVGCIAIAEKFRGQQKSDFIVRAVIDEAIKNRAITVESYPVRPKEENRAYRGSFTMYERLGFQIGGKEIEEKTEILRMEYVL